MDWNFKKWVRAVVETARQLEKRLAEELRHSLLELGPVDRANIEIMQLVKDTQNNMYVAGFYDRMDSLENLLPPVEDETVAQHRKRKLALIALAVNRIHEDPERGTDYLTQDEDPAYSGDIRLIYNRIFDSLKEVNNASDLGRAARWAELAENASKGIRISR